MKTSTKQDKHELIEPQIDTSVNMHRRSFLGIAGLSAASLALIATGCKKMDAIPRQSNLSTTPATSGGSIDLMYYGLWNYSYFLKQFEAAFYTQITANFYSGATADEKQYLHQIKKIVVAHREFYFAALNYTTGGPPHNNAIPIIDFDFSSIDFSNKSQVGKYARQFTGLVLQAFTGSLFISFGGSPDQDVASAIKINSVNARNAGVIDYIFFNGQSNQFFPELGPLSYKDVLDTLNNSPYLKTKVTANNFPNYITY